MSNAAEVQVTIAGGLAEVDRGGPAFNMIPKTGGNTFSRQLLRQHRRQVGAGQQHRRRAAQLRVHRSGGADPQLGHELRVQRPHPARPDLVLQQRADGRHLSGLAEPATATRTRRTRTTGPTWTTKREGPQRQVEEDRRDASHVAGDAEEQVRLLHRLHQELLRLVGLAGWRPVPCARATAGRPRVRASARACRRRRRNRERSGTRARRSCRPTYTAPISSRVLVEAGFSSFWTEWGDIRPAGAATNQIAVTEQTRRRPRRDADLELHLSRLADNLAARFSRTRSIRGIAVVCHRLAQHEVRLPGRVHGREDADVRRAADQLSVQQRRTEPAHRSASGRR